MISELFLHLVYCCLKTVACIWLADVFYYQHNENAFKTKHNFISVEIVCYVHITTNRIVVASCRSTETIIFDKTFRSKDHNQYKD